METKINKTNNIIIHKGYRIIVVSYENDGYNSRTVTTELRDATVVHMVCDMLGHMKSWYSGINQFGNIYEPNDDSLVEFATYMKQLVSKYGWLAHATINFDDETSDIVIAHQFARFLTMFLGDSDAKFFTRACSSVEVEYIPEDITIENVTDQFIK